MEVGQVELQFADQLRTLNVRIADERGERAAGYQWICEADAQGSAVLFVFPRQMASAFHMRNVWVVLDIYFFDDAGAQVDAMVMRPEPPGAPIKPRYYQPQGVFRYALEIARPANHDLESTPAPARLVLEPTKFN